MDHKRVEKAIMNIDGERLEIKFKQGSSMYADNELEEAEKRSNCDCEKNFGWYLGHEDFPTIYPRGFVKCLTCGVLFCQQKGGGSNV